MIFRRSILKEFFLTAFFIFIGFMLIMMVSQLVRFLDLAVGGSITVETVLKVLFYSSFAYVPTVCVISSFITTLSVMSRSWRDSEMVVWLASGQPMRAWLFPVSAFVLPLCLLVFLMTAFLRPWAFGQAEKVYQDVKNRSYLSRLAPGSFLELGYENAVFYIDSVSKNRQVINDIFVNLPSEGGDSIILAQNGRVEEDEEGHKWLTLYQGKFYQWATSPYARVSEFERYKMMVIDQEPSEDRKIRSKEADLMFLLSSSDPYYISELVWIIGLPLMLLVMVCLSVPLSVVGPREMKMSSYVFMIIAYLVYSNFISISEDWVYKKGMNLWLALVVIHGSALMVTLLLWWLKVNTVSLSLLFRKTWSRSKAK